MLDFRTGLLHEVNRPLKRNLLVGAHALEPWNCRVQCFKIHEVERIFQRCQLSTEVGAEPRLPRLHARAHTPQALVQREIVWNVPNGLDPHLLQFVNGAGVDSRQIADVVITALRIAAVKELAGDRISAMASRRDVRIGRA